MLLQTSDLLDPGSHLSACLPFNLPVASGGHPQLAQQRTANWAGPLQCRFSNRCCCRLAGGLTAAKAGAAEGAAPEQGSGRQGQGGRVGLGGSSCLQVGRGGLIGARHGKGHWEEEGVGQWG